MVGGEKAVPILASCRFVRAAVRGWTDRLVGEGCTRRLTEAVCCFFACFDVFFISLASVVRDGR